MLGCLFLVSLLPVQAQKKVKKAESVNDSNTPLHLLRPEYKVPYGELTIEGVKGDMDRILAYLADCTPARVVDKKTGMIITDYADMGVDAILEQGTFRLTSYEWGVTYAAMLAAAQATGDEAYRTYTTSRLDFLAEVAPHFKRLINDYGSLVDSRMRQVVIPRSLDDAGAMCAALIKTQLESNTTHLQAWIDNYINYIMYHQHRLSDGTFARNRPQKNTLWLDDMFMSVPALVQMARLTKEAKYNNEAVRQVLQFSERMFIPERGLYRHGWVEGMKDQASFCWARANGWAILTLTEVLDVLPKSHSAYNQVLEQYRAHVRGIAACQSGEGFWHQLLDRNDSYHETSATAIFVYCIARGINKGWIDAVPYGPVAQLGWQAVSTKINDKGQVEGTCVGTGMGFDPAFYYYRPVNEYAAHGYGTVIWAGAEMISLLKRFHPRTNDNAIQYYTTQQSATEPIFETGDSGARAGSSRVNEKAPVVFTIGDSTMKNGSGEGSNKQWGWGSFFDWFFDTEHISVENHGIGGRSSRSFFTEGRWDRMVSGIKEGDYLLIQFGHNDGGPLNTGRARASLKGIGNESQTVIMERHGGPEQVFTYGHYLRLYIRQAKARGATVIVLSPTPGNSWEGDAMIRNNQSYGKWAKEVADAEGVYYMDMNDILAKKYEALGKEAMPDYFKDRVHMSFEGAVLSAKAAAEGLLQLSGCDLRDYILQENLNRTYTEADIPRK